MDLEETFDKFEEEYLQFNRIEKPLHRRPDLCAFLLLDRLVPGTGDMVSDVTHDEIWLDVDCDQLADVATEEDIMTLVRCGVMYDDKAEALSMFV